MPQNHDLGICKNADSYINVNNVLTILVCFFNTIGLFNE
jgi:hypothetical protein